jgi:hypothetical protein
MQKVRQTIILDLTAALKQATSIDDSSKTRLVKILGIYRDLEAEHEAIGVLKDLKSK